MASGSATQSSRLQVPRCGSLLRFVHYKRNASDLSDATRAVLERLVPDLFDVEVGRWTNVHATPRPRHEQPLENLNADKRSCTPISQAAHVTAFAMHGGDRTIRGLSQPLQ